jgi:hypothetical protein
MSFECNRSALGTADFFRQIVDGLSLEYLSAGILDFPNHLNSWSTVAQSRLGSSGMLRKCVTHCRKISPREDSSRLGPVVTMLKKAPIFCINRLLKDEVHAGIWPTTERWPIRLSSSAQRQQKKVANANMLHCDIMGHAAEGPRAYIPQRRRPPWLSARITRRTMQTI